MEPDQYTVEHVRHALAEDPRVNEPELEVRLVAGRAVITGTVPTDERRRAVTDVVRERLPELEVDNQTTLASYPKPVAEELA